MDGLPAGPAGSAPLPAWIASSAGDVRLRARQWFAQPALAHLIHVFEAEGAPDVTRGAEAVATWAGHHLDTRAGFERHESPVVAFTVPQMVALLEQARPLGLAETPPPTQTDYQLAVVLGGTVVGNQLRTGLLHQFEQSGHRFDLVAGLAAERPLTPTELQMPSAVGHHTEFQHLVATFEEVLGPFHDAEVGTGRADGGDTWREHRARRQGRGPVRLLSAPPGITGRRADTRDALSFLASRISAELRGSVLVVTSAIYVPYQFFVLAPLLLAAGSGSVEVVGTPATPGVDRARRAQQLAQELNSALQVVRLLL